MRNSIQRIDIYPLPTSGSIAHHVETYVTERVADLISDLPADPMLEVATTPRGDYVEVMIFTGKTEIKALLETQTEEITQELRAMGIATAFYVKTWIGVP